MITRSNWVNLWFVYIALGKIGFTKESNFGLKNYARLLNYTHRWTSGNIPGEYNPGISWFWICHSFSANYDNLYLTQNGGANSYDAGYFN